MQERDKVCVGPLKGCTPYDQQVRAKEKTYKKGSRFVSDLSRVGWYDINHRVTPKRKSYTKSYKICFWPRKRTAW